MTLKSKFEYLNILKTFLKWVDLFILSFDSIHFLFKVDEKKKKKKTPKTLKKFL